MVDIFMKRKLGRSRPRILYQFCTRERRVQRAFYAIFLCGIQGKL